MSSPLSSGSSSESSIAPPTRRKRQGGSSGGSDDSDSDTSDASSAAPRPLPPSERTTVLSHAEQRRQKKKQTQERKRQAIAASSGSPHKKRKLDDGTADVSPPSKTETKRTSKAKTKTENKSSATSPTTSPTAVDDPRRQRRQNSVWVGNLAFRTTRDALQGFFDGVGTITRIHMPMGRRKEMQGENMGFAYVDFDTPDAKVIAITLSEGQLDGRNLLIKDGDDFTGRPAKSKTDASDASGGGGGEGEGEKLAKKASAAEEKGLSKTAQKILRAQKQPPAPTLFLGNLGFETTEGSIRELFEAHRYQGHKGQGKGKGAEERKVVDEEEGGSKGGTTSKDVWIRKIRMGTFEDSGACKGFAFVDFTSIEHATTALVNPRNHRLDGRDLVVEYASPDAVRRGGGGPRNVQGDQGRKNKKGETKRNSSASAPYAKQHKPRHIDRGDGGDNVVEATTTTRSRRPELPSQAGHDRPHIRRAKPGAALARAQRQSAAILPSQGQKIVF